MAALFVRVIASWLGGLPLRALAAAGLCAHGLAGDTDPAHMPPFGMLDLSPLVAYLILMVLRWAAFQVLPY